MQRYLLRRILLMVPMIFAASVIIFLMQRQGTGDPALDYLRLSNLPPTPEMVASTRVMLGLNQPLIAQYGNWLWKALHLDFGLSFASQRPVLGKDNGYQHLWLDARSKPGSEPRSLDPHIASGVTEHHLIMALLEGLASDRPDSDDVEPAAAESWEPNATFDTWTFHLRKNGKWSNGDPVRAEDFVFAYRRLLTASIGSEYAEMLYPLKGARAFHQGESNDFATVGAKALDDFTLQLFDGLFLCS